MLSVKTFTVNPLGENCYVVSDESGEAVILDNGALYPDEDEAISKYLADNQLTPVRQILTHAHFDHIFGVGRFYEKYGVKVCFHAADDYLYYNLSGQLKSMMGINMDIPTAPLDTYLQDGDEVKFGNHVFSVLHTPGHSKGGVCYYCEEEKMLFSGDSLFRNSIGRTDLPGGNMEQLVQALQEKIIPLPDDVVVYPGHGPQTSVREEKMNNSYLY